MLSRRLLSLASSSASRVSALRSFHAARPLCAESDPFPLPFDPALLAQQQRPRHDQAEEQMAQWEAIQPIKRVGEDDNKMRARLIYQTRKRGMLENDLLLSTFAKNELPSMTREQMEEFDKLLDENDWDVFYWATEKKEAPERWAKTELLAKLRLHASNKEKEPRRMPDLRQLQNFD